jgi:pSer/pThr/pTyr-binding forkhead associated (FHA) protein
LPGQAPAAETASELKSRVEAERRGRPFLVYRDPEVGQVLVELAPRRGLTIGRGESAEVCLQFDPGTSRLHAELERIGDDWVLIDNGLSRNGTFVNGERVHGRRRLNDSDAMRFGDTLVIFRAPREGGVETSPASETPDRATVTETQRRVLIALCRPFGEGAEFAAPATNKEIAADVFLSVPAVKAHLKTLFERFGVADLPPNQKRLRLAQLALRSGVVSPRNLES